MDRVVSLSFCLNCMDVGVGNLLNFEHTRTQKVIKRSECKGIQSNKLQLWGCFVIRYDIYLLQLGFHHVAVVGKFLRKLETDSCVQKERHYTEQYKNTE